MRRLLVFVALTAAVLSGAAWNTNSNSGSAGNPAAAATTAAADNTKQICDELKSLDEALTTQLTAAAPLFLSTTAPDAAQIQAALAAFQPALTAFYDKLQSEIDKATDPQFKANL